MFLLPLSRKQIERRKSDHFFLFFIAPLYFFLFSQLCVLVSWHDDDCSVGMRFAFEIRSTLLFHFFSRSIVHWKREGERNRRQRRTSCFSIHTHVTYLCEDMHDLGRRLSLLLESLIPELKYKPERNSSL